MLFRGGGASSYNNLCIALKYNPTTEDYGMLPKCSEHYFAMASVNDELVLAGGQGDSTDIQLLDREGSHWVTEHYPKMPTGRLSPAALGYHNYLIVACGSNGDTVEVLDCSTNQWYSAQPVPVGGDFMSAVIIQDIAYISSHHWRDGRRHVFSAHLPTLISNAKCGANQTSTDPIWQKLPPPPVHGPTLLALQDHLLLVGGVEVGNAFYRYEPGRKRWIACGRLPVKMYGPSCAVLPSGELFVAGGGVEGVEEYSQQVWIGSLK